MGEQPLPKHGACCLSSINLSEFVINPYTDNAYFDTEEFIHAVKVGVRTLDKLIDENYYKHPLKEQQEMSFNYRNIGLGCFGYATALMKLGLQYGSKNAIDWTDSIFGLMFRAAVIESNNISKKFGPFPKYKDCVWDSDIIKAHFMQGEIDQMRQYGLRNCSLISIAPTGSIATMLNESGGCEPEFALSFTRRTVGMTDGNDTYYKVYCKAAREYMKVHNCSEEYLPDYFVASSNIPWKDRVLAQAVMQNHVDTAISSTVNLPNEATKEDVENLYMLAWESGLKGVTIYRDGCKRTGILTTEKTKSDENKNEVRENRGRTESNNETTKYKLERGEIIATDDNIIGLKRKLMTGCGSLHCQAFFDPNNGELREIYLSKGSTGGCNNYMTGLSRMISTAARAGVSLDNIVDQLMSTGVCPSYAKRGKSKGSCCPMAVGYALKDMHKQFNELVSTQIAETTSNTKTADTSNKANNTRNEVNKTNNTNSEENKAVCPECGEPIVFEGGCILCRSCGWSKCN